MHWCGQLYDDTWNPDPGHIEELSEDEAKMSFT
jgi:hypothetical protein